MADHIMVLARTSADKFVLLAGDSAHHCGKFHLTPLTPLPDTILPSPFKPPTSASSCPCLLFQSIHPSLESFRTTPFYKVAAQTKVTSMLLFPPLNVMSILPCRFSLSHCPELPWSPLPESTNPSTGMRLVTGTGTDTALGASVVLRTQSSPCLYWSHQRLSWGMCLLGRALLDLGVAIT